MSKNIVSVYDTITKRYVEIEVSEKIRTYYNRTQWNIDDNNKSFYKHEIQFSALKGNINGELENFQSSEQKMTTSKEEWYKILNLKSCIAVWMNFLRMNEGWSLPYISKIKRKTRSLVFYIPLSKTLTKRNVGFCASLTNFWNCNKKRLLNTRLLPLYKCKENKSSK